MPGVSAGRLVAAVFSDKAWSRDGPGWGYSGGHKIGSQGDVLMPFPGRIAYGRYSFAGRKFQLPCNDKEGPNAIHGFARSHATLTLNEQTRVGLYPFQVIHSDPP